MSDQHPTGREATEALKAVAAAEAAAVWRPNRGAVALVAVIFAALIAAATWELFGWVAGLLLALAAAVFLMRRQLSDPRVRPGDWSAREDGKPVGGWGPWSFPLWLPMTILLPPEPGFPGLFAGIAAGVHIRWFFIVQATPRSPR